MSRLMPKAEMLLQASDEERIKYVHTSHWIPYPAAKAIITKLQWMLNFPKKQRMPCLLIVGQSDNGKSTLVTHLRNSVNPGADPEAELTEMPVVLFDDHRRRSPQYACMQREAATTIPECNEVPRQSNTAANCIDGHSGSI